MGFYVCYSELNLFGKVLLKKFNIIVCGVRSLVTFYENNKFRKERERQREGDRDRELTVEYNQLVLK